MGECASRSSKLKNSKSVSLAFVVDTQGSKVAEAPLSLQRPPTALGNFKFVSSGSEYYNNIGSSITSVAGWLRRISVFPHTEGKSPFEKVKWRTKSGTVDSRTQDDGYSSSKSPSALRVSGSCSCYEKAIAIQYDDVSFSSEERLFVQTTLHELVYHSEKLRMDLQQLDLQAPLPTGKTNWEVIREVHDLLKVVVTVLESTVNEVSERIEYYKTSTSSNLHATYYTENSEDFDLCEALSRSFEEVSSTGTEHCLQAIHLVANCIDDCDEITDLAPAFLFEAGLDFVNTCSRITRAQEHMIIRKKGAVYTIEWSLEQEQRRVIHVWKLLETVNVYTIAFQNRVLQRTFVQKNGIGKHNEETSKLESRLQRSWTWLNKLSKQTTVLCPCKKHDLFVYLLETLIQATEELCHFQKLVSSSIEGKRKKLVTSAALSFQRLLLQCLAGLYCNSEEVVAELKRSGLISDCECPQLSVAADNLSQVLNLLLSAVSEQNSTTILGSHRLTEAALNSGNRLIPLSAEYLELVLSISTPVNEGIEDRLKKLCRDLNNVYEKLKVDSDSNGKQTESTIADQQQRDGSPFNSATDKEQTGPARVLTREASGKPSKPSAFANPSSYPAIKAPENSPATETEATLESNTKHSLEEEFPSEGADSSLDRILLSMPCPDSCGRINIREMTEDKHLGSGNSGVVTLMKLNNSTVAVKETVCPDPNRARQRLERECTVHRRINSHINIVRFLGKAVRTDQFGEDQVAGIITEWCQFGDLRNAIKDAAWIQELDLDGQDILFMGDCVGYKLYKDWVKRLEVVTAIAAGMVYMHNHNIVHRDLTCKHVLFDSIGSDGEFGVKICDFERAYYLPGGKPIQRTKAPANSPPWMGPEVLNHEKYGLKADVYSIGTLLWQLMYLENPWTHLKERTGAGSTVIQHLLSTGRISLSISEDDAPADVPEFPDLVRLVRHARERNPDDRPTMAEFYTEVVGICSRMRDRIIKQT